MAILAAADSQPCEKAKSSLASFSLASMKHRRQNGWPHQSGTCGEEGGTAHHCRVCFTRCPVGRGRRPPILHRRRGLAASAGLDDCSRCWESAPAAGVAEATR